MGIIADHQGSVSETNENNNTLTAVGTLQVIKRTIDLTATDVSCTSNSIYQSETMNVSFTVTNSGNTAAGAFRAGVYLSSDASITTGDTFLGYIDVSSINSNGTASLNKDFTIPAAQTAGTYYVGVIADYQGSITEENEANNSAAASATISVQAHTKNIVLQSATIPASATSGQQLSIPYSINNSGNTASGDFRIGVYISEDATVTTADTLIGYTTNSLNPAQTKSGSVSATVPFKTVNKTYYIGMIADDQSAVTETDETDNASSSAAAVTPQKADWVVMVYMAADNSLSSAASTDLAEMKAVNLTGEKVRVITLVDQDGSSDTYLYEVFNGQTVQLASSELGLNASGSGELDTGIASTLGKFIQFTTNNYPATNYQLIIWNHGDGWRNSSRTKSTITFGMRKTTPAAKNLAKLTKGICSDDTSSSYIYNNSVQNTVKNTGITLLSMDACLMGMVETAYEMRKSVTGINYITFSQNTEPGDGYPYTAILNHYLAATDTSASNFASIVVNDYVASYGSSSDVTQSAVDLSKIGDVVTALDSFVTYLGTQTQADLDTARAGSESYEIAYHIDLWHFANFFSDSSVTALKTAIESAVIAYGSGSSKPNAKGLAIYCTTTSPTGDYIDTNNTNNIDFLDDSTWDNFVASKTFGMTIDSAEPGNDSPGGYVVSSGPHSGYIIDYSDGDIYTVSVTASGTLTASLGSVAANCDLDMEIYDSGFNMVGYSYGAVYGGTEYISISATAQTYYVLVYPYDGFNLSDSYYLTLSGTATY